MKPSFSLRSLAASLPCTLVLAAGLLGAGPVAAQIYRCVENGRVAFADRPCSGAKTVATTIVARPEQGGRLPWEGLAAGMSIDEVSRRVPGAARADRSTLNNGARSRLWMPTTIGGVPVVSDYFFNGDDRLDQAHATAGDGDSLDNDVSLGHFERLAARFQLAYGDPRLRDVQKRTSGLSASARWDSGAWISIVPVTGGTSMLTAGYRPLPFEIPSQPARASR